METDEEIEAIRSRQVRALAMIDALNKPKGSPGAREWIMRIPAQPDHDPDLVIGGALFDISALLEENSALRGDLTGASFFAIWAAERQERVMPLLQEALDSIIAEIDECSCERTDGTRIVVPKFAGDCLQCRIRAALTEDEEN